MTIYKNLHTNRLDPHANSLTWLKVILYNQVGRAQAGLPSSFKDPVQQREDLGMSPAEAHGNGSEKEADAANRLQSPSRSGQKPARLENEQVCHTLVIQEFWEHHC